MAIQFFNWTLKVGDILKILWKRGEIVLLYMRISFAFMKQEFSNMKYRTTCELSFQRDLLIIMQRSV